MNPVVHTILVAVLFLFFVVSYIKQRRSYQIVFAVWVLTTLLKYVSDGKTFTIVLGIAQIIFFIVAIFMLFRNKNANGTGNVKKMYKEMMSDSVDTTSIGQSNDDSSADDKDTKAENK